VTLDATLAARLARALDREAKIPRALEALGPVVDREVTLLDGGDGLRAGQLRDLGARVRWDDEPGAADVVIGLWSALPGADPDEVARAETLARPGGRLLVVHDYGRDDVSRLLGDRPGPLAWSRRDGPFLGAGFRVRVVHCFWTFDDLDELRAFLADAFGAAGETLGASLQRPRLSYNIAIYHRTVGVPAA
jgi:hypothetical protein